MKYFITPLLGYLGILLFLSGCNIDIGNSSKNNFTVPVLSGNKWNLTSYPFKDNASAYCVVDGGRNNLRIIMELKKGETKAKIGFESTRQMRPGVVLTINSSDNIFRIYEKSLSQKRSNAILNDILNGQKVYLRWSEPHGGSRGYNNFTNIITANNFIPSYKKCQNFINELSGQ